MQAKTFLESIEEYGISFFAGVPDSLLKPFISELYLKYQTTQEHVVAPNEGLAVGMAAGYYMATQKIPCVYLQNSGIGNIYNPICSLTHENVYGIPVLYVVGWRGEPGVADEPQHVFQGKITLDTLELLQIPYNLVTEDTTQEELQKILTSFRAMWELGKSTALVIKQDALKQSTAWEFSNGNIITREEAIKVITQNFDESVAFVSSTGKISRELYEVRNQSNRSKNADFLTVGSMGHCSAIGYAIAQNRPSKKVICLDGDGALLMHMGALAMIGQGKPDNYIHILLDNQVHETVGCIPTASSTADFCRIAKACGYVHVYEAGDEDRLVEVLNEIKEQKGLTFIRVNVAIKTRSNLGRPKDKPKDNLNVFIERI